MQSLEEIKWIRIKKEEYKLLFNKRLVINSSGGNNKNVDIESLIKKLTLKYNLNLEDFLLKKLNRKSNNACLFIKEYKRFLFENGLSFKEYAHFINRDRTTIMYHLNK